MYHLTFDPHCAVEGGTDSAQDGDGFHMVICGKNFLIHSGATYKVDGEQYAKGVVLSTRATIPLLVNSFSVVSKGTGTSYVFMGWDGKTAITPKAWSAPGILVNDSEITMRVEGATTIMGGGRTTDINSVAPWARP